MSSNVTNQVAFLRTSRNFPSDQQALVVEINRSYVDIAEKVNSRTIGIYPTNVAAITGDRWYLTNNQTQQTLRQVYSFGILPNGATSTIPHGINTTSISMFTRIYGTFIGGDKGFYPLPYVDTGLVTSQVGIAVDATNIQIRVGATFGPTVAKGIVILEWLSPS